MDILTLFVQPLLLGIFTNRLDETLVAPSIAAFFKHLKQDEQQVSQKLEKSVQICILSALQKIVRECHQELIDSASIQRYRGAFIYPTEHKNELEWLDKKLRQLIKELKLVKRNQEIENPLKSIDEIALLLNPESQPVGASVQSVREKIIAQGLRDAPVPQCYAAKVEAVLFEQVRENFAQEVKHNPFIRDIIHTKLLTNINANLPTQKLNIQDVEESIKSSTNNLSEARRTVKLELDIEELDIARLEAIVQHLQQLLDDGSIRLRRIEQGCMELIFDGSEESLKRLDALFKSGKLTEILDIPVTDVRDVESSVASEEALVNLSQWLQNIIDASWKTLEDVFRTQQEQLVFARGDAAVDSIIRVQKIQLAIESEEILLALVVAVEPISDNARDICLQVHPITSKTLPQDLKCTVADISGNHLCEVEAQNGDKWIRLNINGNPGEQFNAKIQIGDVTTIRKFMI